jgi:tetratricopeptide (TPR) repeat protein
VWAGQYDHGAARSIHETRRGLEQARRWEFSDASRKAETLWVIEDRLARKRRYKARSARPASAHRAVSADADWTIDVVVHDQRPGVFQPLSAEDVRGLLSAFPADVRPELRGVHLRLGELEDDMRLDGAEPDPVTGRPGYLEGPVWTPALRGRWRGSPAEIDLFGYVYEPREIAAPELLGPILWLLQAETLAHEVAHAWDATGRRARDRWALDEHTRGEEYAQAQAHDWLLTEAVPYYRRQHREAATAFDSWVEENLGAPIPLERFAEDTDRSIWGAVRAALDLAGVWSAEHQNDHRAEFAEQLHYVDDFINAKAILVSVLALDARHRESVILMGDIAVHEANWPEALEWTARARELFPESADARLDRIDALTGNGSWDQALKEISDGLTSVAADDRGFHRHARRSRALLAADQGLDDLLATDVRWLREEGTALDRATADALEAELNLRRGRADEARRIVQHALRAQRKPPGLWGAMIRAVAWETATDDASQARARPSQWDVDLLIDNGREPWVERLRAAGLVPRERKSRRQADLMRRRGPLARL